MTILERDCSRDAVILLPGIMGSELVDSVTGQVLWGLSDPRWYVKAWTTGKAIEELRVTDDERGGRSVRVRATRTLRTPGFAPVLRGIEPYRYLFAGVLRRTAHPAALREFPYDWRLSVEQSAVRLADMADDHLCKWRKHPDGDKDARLVLVAHSMGGLVARYFTEVLGGSRDVRATVTLGTPFYGSVKAAIILSTGRGAPFPLPQRRLRRLATTMPGLYDLLPSYRCVDEGASARRLTPSDVSRLGGDRELAEQALARQKRIMSGSSSELYSLAGVQQPTMQSLRLIDGVAEPLFYTCLPAENGGVHRVDRRGDSTVYRDSAAVASNSAYLPQSHSALARTEEAVAHVNAVLTGSTLGPPLGASAVGLEIPDVVNAGEPFEIVVSDIDDPGAASCDLEYTDRDGDSFVGSPLFSARESSLVAWAALPEPGLYRVRLHSGGASAITQLILAVSPDTSNDEYAYDESTD